MKTQTRRFLFRCSIVAGGAAVAVGIGLSCLRYSFGQSLSRLSFDLPFLWRRPIDTSEVVWVYLDEYSAKQLHQPIDDVWNRSLYIPLLDRLTAEGARLVFYDVIFDQPAADPTDDTRFAEAIRKNGKVILGAALDLKERQGLRSEAISAPIKPLRKAAAGWGLLAFRPVDADYGVRRIYFGNDVRATATWEAARFLQAPITAHPREGLGPHWIDYYGPPGSFRAINIAQALSPGDLPPGFFHNKVVFIGGRFAVGNQMVGRDDFATPYTRGDHQFAAGTEIHATILLNLLQGFWLTRMTPDREAFFVAIVGLFSGFLALLRPLPAALVALLAVAAVTVFAFWHLWSQRIWFGWIIPGGIEIPLGLAWGVSTQYLLESRRRKELRKAFSLYLSPKMADLIADSDFSLEPGGKVVDATIVFTDLENFTTISEDLDPAEVSRLLIAYFEQTTRCILNNQGTIIKYVGDAVMAAWGAPVFEPAHAARATEAACDLRCLTEVEVLGKKLRTRVGVHSGKVLAGNLGSSFRFDYTMIGDTTNFASRLESLNKYLGTQVLISEAVRTRLADQFVTRRLGEFQVVGKAHSVIVHELLCRCEAANGERIWIDVFESAVDSFREMDFNRSAELMRKTIALRNGNDGPAAFYLRKIAALAGKDLANWNGVIELTEK
jgi:adenylate cyclase